jgi:mono/diheme cytochrome c family protein
MKRWLLILAILFVARGFFQTAHANDIVASASKRFETLDTDAAPDFQRHVVPLLGRLGCNSAKCHGSFQGQGGFRLSLFGFNFQADHASLNDAERVDSNSPADSLALAKPTQQVDHEGGLRLHVGSWEYNLLHRWIASGAKGIASSTGMVNAQLTMKDDDRPAGIALYETTIKPLFQDHCYECHGFDNRKGGLTLTSREAAIRGGDTGPALIAGQPADSLLMQAVLHGNDDLKMPPSGQLKEKQIADLREWIKLGAPWGNQFGPDAGRNAQQLTALRCEPAEILFTEPGRQQIRVIAQWDDGTQEDVTCLSRFQTNDESIATVDSDGLTTSIGAGDTHIVVFYDNGVTAIPVLRPYAPLKVAQITPSIADPKLHPIDHMVNAKLEKLALRPSQLCTDAEFLRRVSIDLTGTLPDPAETIRFLADSSPDKRDSKIDELLERPAYAAWWSNKLCDFTGCNPKSISSLIEVAREEGYLQASQWYDWINERVMRNEPYDKIVEGIMLADLSGRGEGMPTFWTRQSLKDPKDTAMSVAHAFLGIQLQCAECHKHPFDQWTQADFNDFGRFFTSVTTTKRQSRIREKTNLRLLRSKTVSLETGDDPREPIMEWMRDKENPWFARAFVNRVWAGYFHVGIVDPPDQFTPANPPSNPALLEWLTTGFINQNFDMKWLHRQITTSAAYQRSWVPNESNRNDRRNYSRAIPRRIPAEVMYDGMKQATASADKMQEVRNNLQRRASGHLSMRMAGTHAMKVFGKPDRSINCDCERVNEPTLLQSIFTQNDPLVRMRIADSDWVIDLEDAEAGKQDLNHDSLIEQVWLRTVGRLPNAGEVQRAKQHLNSSESVATGISDLLWAMMNTKEFLLNH